MQRKCFLSSAGKCINEFEGNKTGKLFGGAADHWVAAKNALADFPPTSPGAINLPFFPLTI